MAEREVRLARAKWVGKDKIRLRFDPFAERHIRLKVLARDNYTCYWCGRPGDTVDHIIPWSRGGRTTMTNLVTACRECNGERGDLPADVFARRKGVPVPHFTGNEPVPPFDPARLAAARATARTAEAAGEPRTPDDGGPSAQGRADRIIRLSLLLQGTMPLRRSFL
ncbi:HNH endonuclease [Caldinitratiruptor microaerophilus]|uniref:HNH endonuclease n=1 Tax=Caldinitratiruptor microaerophilus TaxID=671077 RepID=UPI002230704F|nr:HNH endonuclease [Caldinitratiruptor microaerophilus]